MTDEIDQLKEFERASRENLSTQYKSFKGLDELRAFQKLVREAEAQGVTVNRFNRTAELQARALQRLKEKEARAAKRKAAEERLLEIAQNEAPAKEVADLYGVSQAYVYQLRARLNRAAEGCCESP